MWDVECGMWNNFCRDFRDLGDFKDFRDFKDLRGFRDTETLKYYQKDFQ